MRRLIAVPTVLLALTAAGCADDGGDPTTAAASSAGAGPRPEGTPGDGPGSAPPTVPGQPMDLPACSAAHWARQVTSPSTYSRAGGTVGCDEARQVMAEFFVRAPKEARDDRGSLAVRGWFCQFESGPTGTWITACRKGDREMHTEEPSGRPTDPAPSEEPGSPESSCPRFPENPPTPWTSRRRRSCRPSVRLGETPAHRGAPWKARHTRSALEHPGAVPEHASGLLPLRLLPHPVEPRRPGRPVPLDAGEARTPPAPAGRRRRTSRPPAAHSSSLTCASPPTARQRQRSRP